MQEEQENQLTPEQIEEQQQQNPQGTPPPVDEEQEDESSSEAIKKLSQDILNNGEQVVAPPAPQQQAPDTGYKPYDYRSKIKFDDESVYEQLEADRKAAEQAAYERGQKEISSKFDQLHINQWQDRFERDNDRVSTKYSKLNPDSPDYNKAYSDKMYLMYYNHIGLKEGPNKSYSVERPNVRFSDYVEAQNELNAIQAKAEQQDQTQRITRQASRTGMRPNAQNRTNNKYDFSQGPQVIQQMSAEEWKNGGREAYKAWEAANLLQ